MSSSDILLKVKYSRGFGLRWGEDEKYIELLNNSNLSPVAFWRKCVRAANKDLVAKGLQYPDEVIALLLQSTYALRLSLFALSKSTYVLMEVHKYFYNVFVFKYVLIGHFIQLFQTLIPQLNISKNNAKLTLPY